MLGDDAEEQQRLTGLLRSIRRTMAMMELVSSWWFAYIEQEEAVETRVVVDEQEEDEQEDDDDDNNGRLIGFLPWRAAAADLVCVSLS